MGASAPVRLKQVVLAVTHKPYSKMIMQFKSICNRDATQSLKNKWSKYLF